MSTSPGTRQIRPGVSAVILDDGGRVLLQRRTDNDAWGLPGGAVEFGESVLDALAREVREETGLAVEIGRLIGVYSHPDHHQVVTYPDGNVIHFVSVCFQCSPAGGTLTLGVETSALAWFAPTELPPGVMPIHVIRIGDALARAPAPFIR